MTRKHHISVNVEWGDCDAAGIVFFPNFSRWMDAASQRFFMACGVPNWRDLERERGIIGTPLLEIHTRFYKPASYGETIEVHTEIESWRRKVFTQHHRVLRGDMLLCEGRETRAFVTRLDNGQLKAIPIPEDIRAMCS
jgi:4-hydroxybenzoyl-CoA thioesterase